MRKWPKKIRKGYWFYPVEDFVYNKEYASKYAKYAKTHLGKDILKVRLDTVKDYKRVLDIGVGCGEFINNKPKSKGYDVNPYMIKKLKESKQWFDPYNKELDKFDAVCFFDSFEHIEKPEILLNKITNQAVVMAIPIFNSFRNVKESKHFRPDEHFHYFTLYGISTYMNDLGFEMKKAHSREIWLGREAIWTFTFTR